MLSAVIPGQITPGLRRGTVEAFVLRAGGVGLLFVMHAALGRTIGTAGYGTFSYVLALTSVLAVMVPLGWPAALMRFIAQYVEQEKWGLLQGVVRRAYEITLASSLAASLALVAVSLFDGLSRELAVSLRFSALLLPFLAFVGLRRRALQGLRKIKASIVPEEVLLPLVVLAGVYLFSVSTASGALLLYTGGALLAFFVGNALLVRGIPSPGRTAKPEFETSFWMATALPMVFVGFSQTVMNRTDILVLGFLLDDRLVGLYGAASRIAILNTFVMSAVNTIGAPMLAAAYYGGRPDQFRSIMRKAALWSLLGALPLCAAMILFPRPLLSLFGAEFAAAAPLLRILAVGQLVNAATGLVGSALVMTGREGQFAWATGLMAVATVAGNLAVVPFFGAVGAAVVTSLSVGVYNLWLLALVSRRPQDSGGVG